MQTRIHPANVLAEGDSHLHLNFATQTPGAIAEGICRLGLALQQTPTDYL